MSGNFRRCGLLVLLAGAIIGQTTPPAAQPPTSGGATSTISARGGQVAIIRIEGLVYDATLEEMERQVDRALEAGATVIVFELDTPGGMVTSALRIAKYIKADIPVPTVAWINKEAYSAGILIASACDQIVMSPASATGDCAPMMPGQKMPSTERAKALSPILAEFYDNARSNGYDYAMFHAMCVLGIEVYLIEHEDTGQRRLVNQADYLVMVERGEFPEPVVLPPGSPPDIGGARPEAATPADRGQWKLIKQVHDGKTLLTVDQERAVELGLARSNSIQTDADLRKYLNANKIARISCTSPTARAVLVLSSLLGLVLLVTLVVLMIGKNVLAGRNARGG